MTVVSEMILSNIPALLCLVIGFALVVVEMYMPGFGVPGISGIILLTAGVILKARNAVEALILSGVIVALLLIALAISLRSIAKGRLSKSKMVLNEVSAPKGTEYGFDKYLDKKGVAVTLLRPAGIGEFEGEKLNVVSEGEFIEAGTAIYVERVEGNRVVVRKEEA